MKLTAYSISNAPCEIVVANKKRKWMDDTHNAFAYRCLPLTVANGFGWNILCPFNFSAVWLGGKEIPDVVITATDEHKKSHIVASHFGSGVLTFSLGFLIQTESNHNLYVKGPANSPKRGIVALEGVVETDWLPFTFTMNWKFTEPNYPIFFEKDEPICSFFPIPRNYIEQFDPQIDNIKSNPELNDNYNQWAESRRKYNSSLKTNGNKGERDYLHGQYKDGSKFEGHQNSIKGKDFVKIEPSATIESPCFDNCCLENEQ